MAKRREPIHHARSEIRNIDGRYVLFDSHTKSHVWAPVNFPGECAYVRGAARRGERDDAGRGGGFSSRAGVKRAVNRQIRVR